MEIQMTKVRSHRATHSSQPLRQSLVVPILLLLAPTLLHGCGAPIAGPMVGPGTAIVTGEVIGTTAEEIIDQTRSAASQLLAEGREAGHAMLITGATELNVAADNMTRLLGDRTNQVLDRLDASERQAVAALQDLTSQVGKTSRGAYELKDSLVLDVRSMLAGLPLIKADTFFIQRISGLTHIKKQGTYKVVITGLGLGPDSENSRSTIAVLVANQREPGIVLNRTQANTLELQISPRALEKYFAEDRVATVDIALKVDREVRRRIVGGSWEKKSYSVPFVLTLLPRRAGKIHVEAVYPVFQWVNRSAESAETTTGNHHCSESCKGQPTRTGYSVSLKVPSTCNEPPIAGDRRLSHQKLQCVSGSCGFSRMTSLTVTECSSRATGRFDVWSHTTVWRVTADVEEYKETGEKTHVADLNFDWEGIVYISIPPSVTTGRVTGELINKERVEFVLGDRDPKGVLRFVQDTKAQSGIRRVVYQATLPPGME